MANQRPVVYHVPKGEKKVQIGGNFGIPVW